MRTFRLMAAVAGLAALAASTGEAAARDYPWCAQLMLDRTGGAENCGFVSLRQCEAYVNGIGGYCERNPRYFAEQRRERRSRRYYR